MILKIIILGSLLPFCALHAEEVESPVLCEEPVYTFKDLAGTISEDITELVHFMKNAEKYTRVNAKMPKGILLHGPGGTGKTSIARAIAGETNAIFFNVSGSEFVEYYVGLGSKRMRDLFKRAYEAVESKKYDNAIIFIDEIDAIGAKRVQNEQNVEHRNTLNELLNQMDGFARRDHVYVIGATNTIDMLDKALLRPGRFDRLIKIDLPTEGDRLSILQHYITKVPACIGEDTLTVLADHTQNCTGAELQSLVNEAAIFAAREDKDCVVDKHFLQALEKVLKQKPYRSPSDAPQAYFSMVTTKTAEPYTFSNLAGAIPEDVKEIAHFIKNSEQYARVNAKVPKGILLYGPRGTGKTSIARAIAGEANAAFFAASGSEFVEMYVGVGAQRMRQLFQAAENALNAHAYAIIFIDEIDAIGGMRDGERSTEHRSTLNELLNQMDGFTKRDNIFVIGATNTIAVLDKALLRPGRFDRLIKIDLPSQEDRLHILEHYLAAIPNAVDAQTRMHIAQQTHNFSGAEIQSLVNEAAVFAAREGAAVILSDHCMRALDKVCNQQLYRL